jgi:hypothetical protein
MPEGEHPFSVEGGLNRFNLCLLATMGTGPRRRGSRRDYPLWVGLAFRFGQKIINESVKRCLCPAFFSTSVNVNSLLLFPCRACI